MADAPASAVGDIAMLTAHDHAADGDYRSRCKTLRQRLTGMAATAGAWGHGRGQVFHRPAMSLGLVSAITARR